MPATYRGISDMTEPSESYRGNIPRPVVGAVRVAATPLFDALLAEWRLRTGRASARVGMPAHMPVGGPTGFGRSNRPTPSGFSWFTGT